MAIQIDRETGQILQAEELTEEQKAQAWALIFRSLLRAHPEALEPEE